MMLSFANSLHCANITSELQAERKEKAFFREGFFKQVSFICH